MTQSAIRVRYINILFAIYMTCLLGCSAFFYYRIQLMEKAFTLVNQTIEVKLKLEQTLSNLREAETEQRGYLLTADSFFIEHYNYTRDKAYKNLTELETLTKTHPHQHENTVILRKLLNKRFNALQSVMKDSSFMKMDVGSKRDMLMSGKYIMEQVKDQVTKMKVLENELLEQRKVEKEVAVEMTPVYVLGILLFSVMVSIICFIIVQRYKV